MTAELIEMRPLVGPAADETVRRTVAGIIEGRKLTKEDVAAAIGMPTSTFYRRLAGYGAQQAFSAGETAALAYSFGVTIDALYQGLGGTFRPPTNPDGTLCLRQDSNLRPSAYLDAGSAMIFQFPLASGDAADDDAQAA